MEHDNPGYEWDLIIIGGGPGGYTAALEAAGFKVRVLLIEKEHMGGVCLNRGCVPTKTMLYSAHVHEKLSRDEVQGVSSPYLSLDMTALHDWKNTVVLRFRKGVEALMKGNRITVLNGEASFTDRHTVVVDGENHRGKNIIIATGTSPVIPPIPGADLPHVMTSKDFLALETIPEPLTVVGGGVIGLEIGSLCAAMGIEVHIVEMEDSLLNGIRPEISRVLEESWDNCTVHLGMKVTSIESGHVVCEKAGQELKVPAAGVLFAVGRKPVLDSLNLDVLKVAKGPQGIAVNERMQTSVPGIYAVGDVTGLSQLAHAASTMGEVAVQNICGKTAWFDRNLVPWVIYTSPESAGCGLTKEEAAAEGLDAVKAKFRLANTARYFAENGDKPGWVTLVAHRRDGRILGIEMVGDGCSEMIFGGAILVRNELTVDDLIATIFPHPTVSEAIRECALVLKKKLRSR